MAAAVFFCSGSVIIARGSIFNDSSSLAVRNLYFSLQITIGSENKDLSLTLNMVF